MTTVDAVGPDRPAGTGRLSRGLVGRARRILLGQTADAGIDADLSYATVIDEAHLITLTEQRLVDAGAATELLTEIQTLRAAGYAALRGLPAPRGTYLLYEGHLNDRLGMRAGRALRRAPPHYVLAAVRRERPTSENAHPQGSAVAAQHPR